MEKGMEREEIFRRKIYSKIEELPTIPIIVTKLINVIEDENSSVSDVVELISKDMALTTKLLKVANSAYYGFSQNISSLNQAVALLGFNIVRSLLVSIEVMKRFSGGEKSEYFSHEGLWLHNLAVATIMEYFKKKYGKNKNSSSIFIIGLLHDLGKIILDQFFHELFEDVLKHANGEKPKSLHIVEKELIGLNHNEVGAMLLKRWRFPAEIINPIEYMHNKNRPQDVNIYDIALLRITNSIAQQIEFGKEGNSKPNDIDKSDLDILSIGDLELTEIKNFLKEKTDDIKDFFTTLK
jgi:putative nucleotidyltransferase with HDIG domain